ncbi:MAG TPA: coproporphyrinogen III oxidase, partial [Gammaproteobacteria bacterium]|nr:coproporphyrinogen III oxidase [Gammaproteobacteria bacterium]
RYFAGELDRLGDMVADGLVEVTSERITLTPAGRLLMRNVAMVFDTYLPPARATPVHSRAI